jgi:hypothetical protein
MSVINSRKYAVGMGQLIAKIFLSKESLHMRIEISISWNEK